PWARAGPRARAPARASSPRPWCRSRSCRGPCFVHCLAVLPAALPLPVAGRLLALALPSQHLAGKPQVGHRAAAAAVVADDALAMARRLREAHVARHHGAEHLVAE